jgi:hypothetical protein
MTETCRLKLETIKVIYNFYKCICWYYNARYGTNKVYGPMCSFRSLVNMYCNQYADCKSL